MTKSKIIVDAIDSTLKLYGYKKKSSNWYFHNNEVVLLVNLQKSEYGNQFYLNLGALIKTLSNIEYPKIENCHIRFRLTSDDVRSPENKADSLLDLENNVWTEDERKAELSKLIVDYALPHLDMCSSMEGISKVISCEKFNGWAIRKNARDLVVQP